MNHGDIVFSVSAPGKVILIGEHSVLFKKLGIASSINKRTYLHFKEHSEAHDQITFNLTDTITEWDFKTIYNLVILDKPLLVDSNEFSLFSPEMINHEAFLEMVQEFINQTIKPDNPLKKSFVGLFYVILGMLWCTDINITPFDIEVTTELTIGAGTGSSASFSVCVAGAVYHYIRLKAAEKHGSGEFNISCDNFKPYRMNLAQHYCGFSAEDKTVINKWAYCVEKIMHGTASGLDNTVCTYGNTVLINHPDHKEGETNFKLTDNFPSLKILLVNTNIPRKTQDLVKQVADKHKLCPEAVNSILNAMDTVATEFSIILQDLKDSTESETSLHYNKLELLIDLQQGLLTTLGVSHPRLDEICNITKRRGFHSKLTGAGGGGYAVTLVPPNEDENNINQVTIDLRSAGFNVDVIIVNGEGLALDFK